MPTTTGARAGGETLLQKFRPELHTYDHLLATRLLEGMVQRDGESTGGRTIARVAGVRVQN